MTRGLPYKCGRELETPEPCDKLDPSYTTASQAPSPKM